MEQETTHVDPLYKKGFEYGYWLKRGNSPELQDIINRSNHTNYKAGLIAGQKEAIREAFRQRMEQMDKDQENDKQRGLERE